MAKPYVALVAVLAALVAVAGPAAADPDDPPQGDASGADESSAESTDARQTDSQASADGSDASTETQVESRGCRVTTMHLLDPRVSPTRWVIPDPDGCIRRTVERALGPPADTVNDVVKTIQSRLPF